MDSTEYTSSGVPNTLFYFISLFLSEDSSVERMVCLWLLSLVSSGLQCFIACVIISSILRVSVSLLFLCNIWMDL